MRRLLRSETAATSRLSHVEIASALARRCREGSFAPAERDRAIAALEADVPSLLVVELSEQTAAAARRLLIRHALRAGDAIQLASALLLPRAAGESLPFVAFDERLKIAAREEGFPVLP